MPRRKYRKHCRKGMAHRWRIEEPHGESTVRGTCQNCGAERAFAAGDHEGNTPWGQKHAKRTAEERSAIARKASAASHAKRE